MPLECRFSAVLGLLTNLPVELKGKGKNLKREKRRRFSKKWLEGGAPAGQFKAGRLI
jgi:hypothetical protein